MEKIASLISGGIDSPVASYMIARNGKKIDYINFYNKFMSGNDRKIIISCIKKINEKTNQKSKIIFIDNTNILDELKEKTYSRMRCVLCKRMMMKIVEKMGYEFIIMGDSLGQVASQTFQNMVNESSCVNIPILRPLVGFDKTEIIKIANEIETIQFSEKHHECSMSPKLPRTKSRMSEIELEESKIDINSMIKKCLKTKEIIEV